METETNPPEVNTETGEVTGLRLAPLPPQALLIEKVMRAAREMARMEKTGQNKFQNYRYLTVEDIITNVRSALLRHGVYFYRRDCGLRSYDLKVNDGKVGTYVTLDSTYILTDGQAEIVMQAVAESRDSGDKAIQKAETSALKYTLLQNFLLQHNEDDLDAGMPEEDYRAGLHQNAPAANGSAPQSDPEPAVHPFRHGYLGEANQQAETAPKRTRKHKEAEPERLSQEQADQVLTLWGRLHAASLKAAANDPLTADAEALAAERMGRFAGIVAKTYTGDHFGTDGLPSFELMSPKQAATIINILEQKVKQAEAEANRPQEA